MNKYEAEKLLRDNGYTTEFRERILFVVYEDEDPFEEVKELLRSNGYEASFGTERRKKSKDEDN